MSAYLLDHGWAGERERLDGLGVVFDPGTFAQLEAIGVSPGWRCLEVGGGSGTVARWLCERAGAGSVVATDLDTGFLHSLAIPNLEVRRHDIVHDDLEEGAFDLIHTRLVLEHLPERARALDRMVKALAPGGWLVVEALQYSGMAITAPPSNRAVRRARPMLPLVFRTVLAALRRAGLDAQVGHQLPDRLCQLGLDEVHAEGRAVFIRGGSAGANVAHLSLARFQELLSEPGTLPPSAPWTAAGVLQRSGVLRRLLAGRLQSLDRLLGDPDVWAMAPVMVAARGRRPVSGS